MAIEYFTNFPDIVYNEQTAKNILLRAALRDVTKNTTSVYLPFTLEYGERSDLIAYDLYKNSGYDWLVKFANGTVDPYFDWPLTDYNLEKFLEVKYGSLPEALATILHYKHNTEDIIINVDTYTLLSGAEQINYTAVNAYDYWIDNNNKKLITNIIAPEFAGNIDIELEKKLND